MSRLTKKNEQGGYYSDYCGPERQPEIQKLGELEDLEEEFGIDLAILFKALKEGFFDRLGEYHHFSNLYFSDEEIFDSYEKVSFNLKDYGKTWALTEEELK